MGEKTLREHMREIAPKGGKALLKKRGKEYFSKLRKKGWKKKKAAEEKKI